MRIYNYQDRLLTKPTFPLQNIMRQRPGWLTAVFVSILFSAYTIAAFGPVGYSCDPNACKIGSCQCPSLTNPGGLQPSEIPQFVLVTHDDAISELSNFVVRSAIDGFKNPNGCNVPATWFTTTTGTVCELAKKLYDENHEIAIHTVNHAQLDPGMLGMEQEIMGARDDLVQCGIPKEKMVGFRAPYLVHNPEVRSILKKNGMLYDSSIIDFISSQSPTTRSIGQRLWPYTMDNGIAQECSYTPAGQCDLSEKYPGMWEVPLWPLLMGPVDTDNNAYSMDPGPGFGGDVLTTLKTNFDQAYAGNRAPVPLFTHAPWFTDENINATREFINYALSKGDVYFVTAQELLAWMVNPVPAAQYKTMATCKPVNAMPPIKKKCQVYEAQVGDFFASIAGKFGVLDMLEMSKINPSLQTESIRPGMRINIPPWDDTCPPSSEISAVTEAPVADISTVAVEQPTPIPDQVTLDAQQTQGVAQESQTTQAQQAPQGIQADSLASPRHTLCQTWTVAEGEFLEGIAKATGASAADIASMNGLQSTPTGSFGLSLGQQLKIPPYPECCATGGCTAVDQLANAPKTRVDVNLNLVGTQQMDPSMLEQIKVLVAGELDIPAGAVTATIITRRRGRRLRQAVSTPTNIVLSIATTTPIRLAQKVSQELQGGDLETLMGGVGYAMNGFPLVKAYQDGAEVVVPELKPRVESEEDSGLSIGAIVGIAVGGAAALVLLVGLVVFFVLRRQRRSQGRQSSSVQSVSGMTATVSLRETHKKGDKRGDPVAVVIGGYDTPRSGQTPRSRRGPSSRTFDEILATHNPAYSQGQSQSHASAEL